MTEVLPTPVEPVAIGTARPRVDGRLKVLGAAPYSGEHEATELADWLEPGDPDAAVLFARVVQSRIATGRVTSVDATAARAHPGVIDVYDHTNAPRLDREAPGYTDELGILQDDVVHFRGQVVAIVVAETYEAAHEGAALVEVAFAESADAPRLDLHEDAESFTPDALPTGEVPDTVNGDVEAGLAGSTLVVDQTYRTPYHHHNPLEPHATMALWRPDSAPDGPRLSVFVSNQQLHVLVQTLAPMFGLEPSQMRARAPHIGGAFGSKGLAHVQDSAACLAARALPGRVIKLSLTRQQLFPLAGHRTATIQHVRLGADADGRLLAIDHQALMQTSPLFVWTEQTSVMSRVMYAAPHRRTTHRGVLLDLGVNAWMRAPGETPGSFATEVAMDELAEAAGLDPIELRRRNEPAVNPTDGKPFNGRRLMDCYDAGAGRFGWDQRNPEVRATLRGQWWVGSGVASSTYTADHYPDSQATVRREPDGRYAVEISAVDLGTGAWTVLAQIAADALGVPTSQIELGIGDSRLPFASPAGGSTGTTAWGSAIVAAAQAFRAEHGADPAPGAQTTASAQQPPERAAHSMHSFGAIFAEVAVHRWTGELRVPRLYGQFSIGRAINPTTVRSQLLGGMVWGLSSALHEDARLDQRFGHVVTQDLASYHVPANADVQDLQADFFDEFDPLANAMGSRGVGEIGIVGTAAAIANAAHHATGVRVRALPLTADLFL